MDIIGIIGIDVCTLAPSFWSFAGSAVSSLIDNLCTKVPASYVKGGFGEFFLGYFEMIEKLLGLSGG